MLGGLLVVQSMQFLMLDEGFGRASSGLVGRRSLSLGTLGPIVMVMNLLSTKSPLLLAFQLVIKKVESLFVCLRRADNREHALARFVMGFFGNRNL